MSNLESPKKKSKKKVILIVVVVLFIMGAIGSLIDDDPKEVDSTNQTSDLTDAPTVAPATATPEPTFEPTVVPTKEPEPEPTETPVANYESGMYKVGSDIPAGEYIVFADNTLNGYMEIGKSSNGDLDGIVANQNFTYNTVAVLVDGNYLTLSGAYAVPFDDVTELDTSGEGMFKVGVHIKAGEYQLECIDGLSGYYEVSSDSTHDLNSIVANGNFDNNTYVTVSDGQYLTISGCKIK